MARLFLFLILFLGNPQAQAQGVAAVDIWTASVKIDNLTFHPSRFGAPPWKAAEVWATVNSFGENLKYQSRLWIYQNWPYLPIKGGVFSFILIRYNPNETGAQLGIEPAKAQLMGSYSYTGSDPSIYKLYGLNDKNGYYNNDLPVRLNGELNLLKMHLYPLNTAQ